ncbi:3,4-dihydroxy 2-butanone 4-phosphate synthase / GTP cyclohydrolase II [Candidatus Planktophila lacus]|uniref:3,4-dihydroxy-2-butanone-4-phosphate synthase n=1 Tax=Candidatus Planktophila lacus TaxID=1884913 RepID=UPI000BAC73D8|nr:3,4-dihydroxy-2-butanone-4-phosphate synthase [Candidatus Planktophila lacus]ASY25335.1 3,4-dihydroxy 2-butanone 4-phosphate synthase / GTP cyclohydrolase II [Candidatus Planktophila lacus]
MSNLEKALSEFKAGKFIVVTDDENRENEADLILLADKATPENIGFMVRYTSGVICGIITEETAKKLKLPLMVKRNEDNHTTAFTVTVDAIAGRSTGIPAAERANTLRALANASSLPTDFARPGHVFPLISVPGGLHQRRGHTEASMALCELTGSNPCAVLSELVNDDGSMMRGSQITEFAKAHDLEVISIDELSRVLPEKKSTDIASLEWAELPLGSAQWQISTYISPTGAEHAVLKFAQTPSSQPVVRVHSECLTGDVFGSKRCDCGPQLQEAIRLIEENGHGYVIYLRDHEGRGIGLAEKIRAYVLQDSGQDTVEANISIGQPVDDRTYEDAAEILNRLKVKSLTLLTNNPEKIAAIKATGISLTTAPLEVIANKHNQKYLETKRDKLNHALGAL